MLTCNFCKKDFVKETSMAVHMCEPKRRRMEKDERGVQLGFQAYIKFYETMQGSARLKTFEDFAESAYYKAFVKFGRYCLVIRAINPARFMDWLLKNNKKLDRWCSDQLYTEYLIEYVRIEHVDDALARSIEWSIAWAEEHDAPAQDCLRYGNANTICYALTSGRISPWCIYNSDSGIEFLGSLTEDQVAMIWPYIESDVWQRKFRDYPADVEYVKDILKQAGW
jgi:hypothetical protein